MGLSRIYIHMITLLDKEIGIKIPFKRRSNPKNSYFFFMWIFLNVVVLLPYGIFCRSCNFSYLLWSPEQGFFGNLETF